MTRFQVRKKLLKASTGKTLTGFSLRKKLLKAGVVATFTVVGAATFSTGQAHAVVVTFDDLSGNGDLVPDNYGGIRWDSNWSYYGDEQFPYTPSSNRNRIYNNYDKWGDESNDIPFYFNSPVVFDGAFFAGYSTNPVVFKLYKAGLEVATSATLAPSSIPTFLASGYNGLVDEVRIGGGASRVVDNVTYNSSEPVPEPFTILGSLTAGGIGVALRRKRQQQEKETAKV
jgi:hypothetical protein